MKFKYNSRPKSSFVGKNYKNWSKINDKLIYVSWLGNFLRKNKHFIANIELTFVNCEDQHKF